MWRDPAWLLDMLLAARKARRFTTGIDWDGFQRSELHQQAVLRLLEIIGEAARRVSAEAKSAHPEVPWAELTGMRNRLVHEYFRIDLQKVWDTVQNNIPRLIASLEPLVPPEDR